MNFNTIDFITSKTKIFLIVSLFFGVPITLIFGLNMGLYYYCGFLVGLINFIALSIGTNMIIENTTDGGRRGKSKQTLFFGFRYVVIAASLVVLIKYLNANVFALVTGLLTIHIALIIPAIKEHIEKRKEG
ncbi:MAG: ATP synthase subunit I [Clostridium sp.]